MDRLFPQPASLRGLAAINRRSSNEAEDGIQYSVTSGYRRRHRQGSASPRRVWRRREDRLRRRIRRLGLKDAFEKLPPCIVGMEACLSAHFVSRTLRALGHQPRIIPAIYVKPFVKGQKNDYNDAE